MLISDGNIIGNHFIRAKIAIATMVLEFEIMPVIYIVLTFVVIREFKIQVHVATCTAKRTYDVIFGVFIKLRTSSYKFTT